MNILITSIGRETPLVFSFQKAFKKLGIQGKLTGIDMDPYAVGLSFVDGFYLAPRHTDPNFPDFLKDIISQEKIDLVIPTSDLDVAFLSKNRNEIEEYGCKLLISSSESIDVTNTKLAFFEYCHENHIKAPKVLTQDQETHIFPLFINSDTGRGSRDAHKINDIDELNYFLKEVPEPILTEYLEGQEYSVDCFCDFDGKIISIIPRKRKLIWGGEAFVTISDKNENIIERTKDLLEKFKISGPANVQCFLTPEDDVVFFEVNPRFGGASRLAFEAGADTPELLLRIMQGEKIDSRVGEMQDKLSMLRYKDDLFLTEADIEKIKQKAKGNYF